MNPRIETLATKKLVGKSIQMTLAKNKTPELWKSFMPERKSISNSVGGDLYSMQVYDPSLDFATFNPQTPFIKWAATEVSGFENIPSSMDRYLLEGGLYAVFIHKGATSQFPKTMQYIFGEWLPSSIYLLDKREHFELLGERYINNHPDSEEEVWIPIKPR